jgi:hypothetical protein
MAEITKKKAKQILREGKIGGKRLTKNKKDFLELEQEVHLLKENGKRNETLYTHNTDRRCRRA